MANVQYIGARYVPIIYTNPDDNTANWKSGVTYEALTIVTYGGDSYTSKKAVPDNVGDPASNPSYWVKTGDFNASLIALQNQVSNIDNVKIPAINNDISAINDVIAADDYLSNKKIAIFGDSLSMPAPAVGVWAVYFKTYCENRGCTVDNFALAGNAIDGVAAQIVAHLDNTYDICIIETGTNDFGQPFDVIKSRTALLRNAVNTYTGDIWLLTPPNRVRELFDFETPTLDMISAYLYNVFSPMKNVRVLSMSSFNIDNLIDDVHPDPSIGDDIGKCVVQGMLRRTTVFNMQTGRYMDLTKPTIGAGNDNLTCVIHLMWIEDVNSIHYKCYFTVTPDSPNEFYTMTIPDKEMKSFFTNSFIDRIPLMIAGGGSGYLQFDSNTDTIYMILNGVTTGNSIDIVGDALFPVMKYV